MKTIRTSYRTAAIIFALFFFADILSKEIALQFLQLGRPVPVFGKFLQLTLVHNTGLAFGQLKDSPVVVYILSAISPFFLLLFLTQISNKSRINQTVVGIVCAGGCGNLIERGFRENHAVTDFVHVQVMGFSWPAFNFADIYLFIGATVTFFLLSKKEAS